MNSGESSAKDEATVLSEKRTAMSTTRTEMSLKRTIAGAERTLMAWIRTALSMIGFGFTIYKFFQYMSDEAAKGSTTTAHPNAARNLGLSLIALGTVALAAATWDHVKSLNDLGVSHSRCFLSISFLVAIAVVLIGLLAFYGVSLRHGPF